MAEIAETFDYNPFQRIHCLNAASNVVGHYRGTQSYLQNAMQNALTKALPRITGSWEVAWGPAMFKYDPENPDTGPVNAWYIAKDDKEKTCVVSIAGTAITSLIAWLGDFNVNHIVPFDDWTAKWTNNSIPSPWETKWKPGDTRSLCSRWICQFVHNILTTASPGNAASPGTTIISFLQKLQANPTKYQIFFTGHSLGGAVSPALAHGLVRAKLLKPQDVNVLPTAGATPGNTVWNSSFSRDFPPSGSDYQAYNSVLFNHRDIVPQAWSIENADDRNIFNILGKIYTELPDKLHLYVKGLVNMARIRANAGMPYAPLPGSDFQGPDIPLIETREQLLEFLHVQHSLVYWEHIGIEDFVKLFWDEVSEQPGVEPLPDTSASIEISKVLKTATLATGINEAAAE